MAMANSRYSEPPLTVSTAMAASAATPSAASTAIVVNMPLSNAPPSLVRGPTKTTLEEANRPSEVVGGVGGMPGNVYGPEEVRAPVGEGEVAPNRVPGLPRSHRDVGRDLLAGLRERRDRRGHGGCRQDCPHRKNRNHAPHGALLLPPPTRPGGMPFATLRAYPPTGASARLRVAYRASQRELHTREGAGLLSLHGALQWGSGESVLRRPHRPGG